MKQRDVTGLLCFTWAMTLLYGEMFAFWVPYLWSCSWPHHHLHPSGSGMEERGNQNDYAKIVVLADPQLMDKTSLHLAPKSLLLETAQFYTDLYMRRAYLGSIWPFRPDAVIFLGDYFDGGSFLSDEEWQDSLHRFKHIFDLKAQGRHADFQVYYIPGNHDIGYAILHPHKPQVISRYESEFGERNYKFRVGNAEFIVVDAQTLDAYPPEKRASASWDFVKNVSSDSHSTCRVLLTHIPLHRPDGTDCGSNRRSPIINQRIRRAIQDQGILYQNYVTEESSKDLLDLIQPVLVLSGHDHDQCAVKHESKSRTIEEITLGTISWQMGNLFPSFMLISIHNFSESNASSSSSHEAVLTELCFLPIQTYIYIWYLGLFVLTIFALLFWPTNSTSGWSQLVATFSSFRQVLSSNFLGEGRKEKTDDEDCEYEEIWDAEGYMHLMKKSSNHPHARTADKASIERGSAVIRPTARKLNQDEDSFANLDINIDGGLDLNAKMIPKSSRSISTVVIQRLVRLLRMLTVIAAVNVPLYMMLLFKDWNDQ
ncbi:hypothetical protein SAY87_017067 [Trapa incisa]|uniref:Calcineurin-like phosphoesterase domain-containing protein n=1 Tax=Trapa incisa TaxID=236973 RepID=A0AAN7QY31_9MYRT|nr:hypothetical protein SAY87_017067 [Trapa incisa]